MGEAVQRRVLLVEDQGAIRGLVRDLFTRAGFAVLAVGSAHDALTEFDAWDPDAIVADIDLGSRPDGAELVTILRRRAPHLAVLFLTSYPRRAAGIVPLGIDGAVFVEKHTLASPEDLLVALEHALRDTGSLECEGGRSAFTPGPGQLDQLTRHQLTILSMLARGWSNEHIAAESGSTTRAVERTVSRVFERLALTGDAAVNPRVRAAGLYLSAFGPVQ